MEENASPTKHLPMALLSAASLLTLKELQSLMPLLNPSECAWLDRILTAHTRWSPISEPQLAALLTPAAELYYGGAAGGGKTDLLLGAPITEPRHHQGVIFRREYPQLKGIIQRSRELYGRYGSYHTGDKLWRLNALPGEPLIEFAQCADDNDLEKHQGRAKDYIGFDELPQFTRYQYIFLTGWLRSAIIGQRQRVIGAGNPPLTAEGEWVVDYWAPWIKEDYQGTPALPGELRWFAMIDNKDTEVPDAQPFTHKGELIRPLSRTFIPARVEDNPILMASNYKSRLQAFPEPLRSQLLQGKFNVRKMVPNRVYWGFSNRNLNAKLEYHRDRDICMSLDFNVQPAVVSFGHELIWGEYPPDQHEDGVPQFGFFGELHLKEDYDATRLTLLAVTGKDRSGSVPEGWHLPDEFKGLMKHNSRLWIYGDASGAQKRIESEDNRTAWMYVTSVLDANMPGRYTLMVPDANPSVIHSAGVTNYKFCSLGNRISLWVHPRCKAIRRDAEENKWINNAKGELVIDKSNPDLTHAMDTVRYLVMERYRNNMKTGIGANPMGAQALFAESLESNLRHVPGLVGPGGRLPWE